MEVPLLVKDDAAAVKHEEDCLMQDATLMRRDQPAGCVRRDKTPVVPEGRSDMKKRAMSKIYCLSAGSNGTLGRLVTAGANVVGALAEPETGEVAGVGNRSPAK
ncbi:hypothetical protein B296_00054930 [Ensete ventricosum]|uniref:Uncharacterized protein n=1 Tax=Ensete ventricosum TaxID=4639 RepID=A0A426X803_ENSVE|nr:hypothetical protein B296_00054930 [Ensete ventricosum]